jgi:hypothetical protein
MLSQLGDCDEPCMYPLVNHLRCNLFYFLAALLLFLLISLSLFLSNLISYLFVDLF